GRDGAGKGGVIKAITERVSPRVFRVIALPAPSDREKSQMYVQRYLPHLPAAGEIVIFDRSWYNRAGVERVMGFADEKTVMKFLEGVPKVEKAMVDSGIILIKYWLEVSMEEQTRRLKGRIDDPLGDLDVFLRLRAYGRFISLPVVSSRFRWHDDSLTVADRAASTREAMRVKNRHLPSLLRPFAWMWNYPVAGLSHLAARRVSALARMLEP
ncbi:MAG: hypothetical protein RL187_678, partial [Actinomycetota bacterium]